MQRRWPRAWILGLAGALVSGMAEAAQNERSPMEGSPVAVVTPEQLYQMDAAMESAALLLEVGEIRNLSAKGVTRVAVGDPKVVDVSIVSDDEVLLQAKDVGSTNLIIWDADGQHFSTIQVSDPAPEQVAEHLANVLSELKLPEVYVKREGSKVFLVGYVERQDDADRVEQMLTAFPDVTNLVSVFEPAPVLKPISEALPLVKLSVQVIEISRKDVENLGVQWSTSFGLSEPSVSDLSFSKALTAQWGSSITRDGISAKLNALVQKNRARLLAEPKLVTTTGKEASTFVGIEVPYITGSTTGVGTGTTSVAVSMRETGVLLSITPEVLDDQRIATDIKAEVSSIDRSVALAIAGGSTPGFAVRRANTNVTTTSGETILIAGLLKTQDSESASQVPALGSMPIVGRLFRNPLKESEQQELIIAVTPELLSGTPLDVEQTLKLEQALARADVTPAVSDPTLRYALQIQDRIARALRYPRAEAAGMKGTVTLRLHLLRTGQLQEAAISQSSGIESFDRAAMDAARSQSPYPPFPLELTAEDVWLELPVVFRP